MKRLLRKWLGISALDLRVFAESKFRENSDERLQALEDDFNSREACKICGKHRYNSPDCLALSKVG